MAADIETSGIDPRARALACDLFEIDDPFTYFGEPDVLLHLAWRDNFVHSSGAHLEDLPKHRGFIAKMAQSRISALSVMGSMHEIGYWEGAIDEDTPCKPMSPYGEAKNALREFTVQEAERCGKTLLWLRGFYIVGEGEEGENVFAKIVRAARSGQTSFPFTSGTNQNDFMDYKEFCYRTARAITQDEVTGIINICSGTPEPIGERAERFIKEHGLDIRLDYGAFEARPYDSPAVWGDAGKIGRILRSS